MRNNFSNLAADLNLKEYEGFIRPLNAEETDHLATKVPHQSCLVEWKRRRRGHLWVWTGALLSAELKPNQITSLHPSPISGKALGGA